MSDPFCSVLGMENTARPTTREALAAIAGWIADIDPGEWEDLPEPELLDVMRQARRVSDRVTGLAGMITATTERGNAAMLVARTPLSTLIAQEEHRDGKDATRSILQARTINRNPDVANAVLIGAITTEHARGVVKAMGELPVGVTRSQATQISSILIDEARRLAPSELPTKAKRALQHVAPDLVPGPNDEDRILAEQRRIALRRRSFQFGDDGEGSTWFHGQLPHLEAEPLIATLTRMVANGKRAERDKPANSVRPEATREQRYADALAQLAQQPVSPGHRPPSATVIVTIKEEDLHARAHAAGILSSGRKIPAGELRRLLCEARILPVVLGGDSEILDIGLERRFVTPALRRALALRDGGCVFPGCVVPVAECDAHHVAPWQQGGPTTLGNLVLLCAHHHGLVEPRDDEPGSKWQIGFHPATRKPVLTRPGISKPGILPHPHFPAALVPAGNPCRGQPLLC